MNWTVFQLHRRLAADGFAVNIKSLYRLASDDALEKIDLRIAAAICSVCKVSFGELITLEKPRAQLGQLDAKSQSRLSDLMEWNNDGKLTAKQKKEFQLLAEKAHRISLENARVLLAESRRGGGTKSRVRSGRAAVAL
jgi:hypothetical protein